MGINQYPPAFSTSVDTTSFAPVGVVLPYAGANSPNGWLLCDGAAVSRTTYATLFSIIGTTYGDGDATTTFNLPDMRGRVPAGKDNMGGSAANRLTSGTSGITGTALGNAGGSEAVHQHSHANTGVTGNDGTHSHAASSGNMSANASHSHSPNSGSTTGFVSSGTTGSAAYVTTGGGGYVVVSTDSRSVEHTHSVSVTTTSSSHGHTVTLTNADYGSGASANVQPTIVLNYIIKV